MYRPLHRIRILDHHNLPSPPFLSVFLAYAAYNINQNHIFAAYSFLTFNTSPLFGAVTLLFHKLQ
jgi:hypothetical protein